MGLAHGKQSTTAEIFDLSCQLADVTGKIQSIMKDLERLGGGPSGEIDASKARNPRWRKKVTRLLKQADELMEQGNPIRQRLAELGVPMDA